MVKFAIPQIRRNPDGTSNVIYLDVQTLRPLSEKELGDYNVISLWDQNLEELGLSNSSKDNTKDKEKDSTKQGRGDLKERRNERSGDPNYGPSGKGGVVKRDEGNNFGYYNKPGWLGIASAVPGPLGKVAAAVNGVINANNVVAVNASRKHIGLPELSVKDQIKGVFKDNQGVVGKLTIGDKTYTVGLEAMAGQKTGLKGLLTGKQKNPGVTTLTPQEAKQRQAMAHVQGKQAEFEEGTVTEGTISHGRVTPSSIPQGTVDYSSVGHNRPHKVDPKHESFVTGAVANAYGMPGGVMATSGHVGPEDPGYTAEGGRYSRSGRHTNHVGMDMQPVNPVTGKPETNPARMGDIAMAAAAANPRAGIGYGLGYMGASTMHLDQSGLGGVWGGGFNQNQLNNIAFARATGIGPTPAYGAPVPSPRGIENTSSLAASTENYTGAPEAQAVASVKSLGTPQSSYAPAQMAAAGFLSRTPEQRKTIAQNLAGELGPSTLAGLARGDIKAQTELANMITTVENRAYSVKFGQNFNNVFTPSQYNAVANENMATTNENYAKYGAVLDAMVDSYYTPNGIKPSSYGLTHFYNPSQVNPTWGQQLKDAIQIGDHRFGSYFDTVPGSTAKTLSGAAVSDIRGWTPSPSAGAFAGRIADSRGTFGSTRSPGYGRSSIATGPTAERAGKGTFGTTDSPGYGRSSFSGGSSAPSGGFSNRNTPSGFGTSSSIGAGRSSISGGSSGSHPGASQGHSGVAGGAGGHAGSKGNDRGGFAGL